MFNYLKFYLRELLYLTKICKPPPFNHEEWTHTSSIDEIVITKEAAEKALENK